MENSTNALSLLLSIQRKAQSARDKTELFFLIANETWHLVRYRQAFVVTPDLLDRPAIRAVTGLANVHDETPFTLWFKRLLQSLNTAEKDGPQPFGPDHVSEELREGWAEWWPDHALLCPLASPGGKAADRRLGSVVYVREIAWEEEEIFQMALAHEAYGHCLAALDPPKSSVRHIWQKLLQNPRKLKYAALGICLLLLFPVRMSVLATAEVIAMETEAVAAPMDGVIQSFAVPPNTPVKAGDVLFRLDDTILRNRRQVALEALGIASANALTAQQKAFESLDSKAEVGPLNSTVKEKQAEVAYIDDMLTRLEVRAFHDGIFIYTDQNDWMGRPITTGERIGQLAQPGDLGVRVWLPVNDAISLEKGAPIRVYLQVAPLSVLSAQIIQTSYQTTQSPEGVAAYTVRGQLYGDQGPARVGLRGVAKVFGEWRPVIYWILRRPIGAIRQALGV